jgi:hypothetical protein
MLAGASRFAVLGLLATCMAVGQERGERRGTNYLPDAPSAVRSKSETVFRTAMQQSWNSTALAANPAFIVSVATAASYKLDASDEQVSNFLARELTAARTSQNFKSVESGGLLGRAISAASSTFITRTPSGQARLNTSYFLGVLTTAVIHTAYRPYWNRPVSTPFSNFGSTVGNDAGVNLLHEFAPGLQQLMKSHTPRFVSRIEADLGHK